MPGFKPLDAMPELPEVEVTRRSFAQDIAGALVTQVRVGKSLRWPLGCEPGHLQGHRVLGVRRRGKYLLIDLDHGVLLCHLGMSGALAFRATLPAPGPHDHFDLVTSQGGLRLHDPRRFGAMVFVDSLEAPMGRKLLQRLGVEPLEEGFDPVVFHAGLKRRQAPIKQVLLAGELVVGVGNIYASEALFHAGIRPTTAANRISMVRLQRLLEAIRKVLAQAVQLGGSSLQDFVHADGHLGDFQHHAMVYGRQGQPCRVCGSSIQRLVQAQRASYYCPKCQKP